MSSDPDELKMSNKKASHLKNIIYNDCFCCTCFGLTSNEMFNLDDIAALPNDGGSDRSNITLEDILDKIFLEKAHTIKMSRLICKNCCYSLINAYSFIQDTIKTAEKLEDYVNQLDNRMSEIETIIDDSNVDKFANTVIVINDQSVIDSELKYSLETDLKANIEQKTTDTFQCAHCHETFLTKNLIRIHIKTVHRTVTDSRGNTGKIFKKYKQKNKCPDCEISMNLCEHKHYLESYNMQKDSGEKSIKCPDCDYICYAKTTLTAHANKKHLRTFKFKCESCSKPLHSKLAYKIHMKSYHTVHYKCEFCEKVFLFDKNLQNHRETCKTISRDHKCCECPASFDTKDKLNAHSKKHQQEYPCHLCNKVLATEGYYKQHLEVHESNKRIKGQYNYICPYCNMIFPTVTLRDTHILNHDPNEEPGCSFCKCTFGTVQQFFKHLKSRRHYANTDGLKYVYNCKLCDYSGSSAMQLESHVNRYHLKIAPYTCNKCEKKFLTKLKLNDHMKSHTAIKTHTCEVCSNLFGGPSALKKHLRLHSGEKPYLCIECGESFISSSVLKSHVLKSHSTKTIKCPLCTSMFYVLPALRSHIKRVHWKKKDETFDITKVEGLTEQHYDLFRDRRMINLET